MAAWQESAKSSIHDFLNFIADKRINFPYLTLSVSLEQKYHLVCCTQCCFALEAPDL